MTACHPGSEYHFDLYRHAADAAVREIAVQKLLEARAGLAKGALERQDLVVFHWMRDPRCHCVSRRATDCPFKALERRLVVLA